ncbi:hypothetical protein [Archangium violaceum]|uniref:hypothetical protein n=1 Tax=Archangium violaceum TaxID=83451 RepID=UPI0036DA1D4D
MLEFIGDWLSNTVLALCFTLSTVLPTVFLLSIPLSLLWDRVKSSMPARVSSKMTMPSIRGRYIVMTVLLGALGWGLFQASGPKEPKEVQRPGGPSQTPLQQCISGETPPEFLKADRKMLRVLRFTQEESEIDLNARHGKQSRKRLFLSMEGEQQGDIVAEVLAEQAELTNLWKYQAREWEGACRAAASRIERTAPAAAPVAAPAEP